MIAINFWVRIPKMTLFWFILTKLRFERYWYTSTAFAPCLVFSCIFSNVTSIVIRISHSSASLDSPISDMPHPRTSSEKPHDRPDLHETTLARHFRTSCLQTLCASFPVPARVCTSLSGRLLHPGWCNWRTVKSTISGYRPVVRSVHQDCDNRPTGIRY